MDELEHAYYLDTLQLLLLLSLVDSRPLLGPSLGNPDAYDAAAWRKVALTLVQEGWLVLEDGKPAILPDLRAILKDMKDASRILAAARRAEDGEDGFLRCTLYLHGSFPSLEPDGPNGWRLSRVGELTASWLSEEAGLGNPHLPEDLIASMEHLPEMEAHMASWQERMFPMEVPAESWEAIPECRLILDLHQGADHHTRWVFLTDPLCDLVLEQSGPDNEITLDSLQRRQMLLEACPGTEGKHAAG